MPGPVKTLRPAKSNVTPAAAKAKSGGAGSTSSAAKKTLKKSRLISSKLVFKGRVVHVYSDKVEEPSGVVVTREVIRHVGSVVILAIDESKNPKDPDVILERQYRHAVGGFLFELPAGRIEPGETALAAGKREMIEETGYRAKRWKPLTKYYASPGFLGERMQIFIARDIREGIAQPEPDEQIEILRMPLSQAMALVRSNKIQDGKTMIGLSLLDAALREGTL